ncbi:hypothetical protein YR28_23660 [Salmonella enterica subsp. enterica]|nr:hypothetical protein [Salmonella enterica subsp. enterica]
MLNKSPDDAQTLSSLRNPATIFRIAVSKYVAQSAHKNAIIRREWSTDRPAESLAARLDAFLPALSMR